MISSGANAAEVDMADRDRPLVALSVAGVPTTQGSKKAYVVGKKGGPQRAIVVDVKRDALRSWRDSIRFDVAAMLGHGWTPVTGPVRVELFFTLPKPISAPKRRRTWPVSSRSGDIDKLERAVLDALTDSGLWRDDSQVVDLRGVKDYPKVEHGDPGMTVPGVFIYVAEVGAS